MPSEVTRFHKAQVRELALVNSWLERQDDTEGRAAVWSGLNSKCTRVFLDDTRGDRESQTGATLLCREERIEEPLLHV
jgi:hypothetical protein